MMDRQSLILELKITAAHLQKDGRVGASGAVQKAIAEFERSQWSEPHVYLDLTKKSAGEVSAMLRKAADDVDGGLVNPTRYALWIL